jgi:DNA-binding NtrC family response regulator
MPYASRAPSVAMSSARANVLIIDDDEDLRLALADLLEATSGRRVIGARDLDELAALGPLALACGLSIIDVNLGPGKPGGVEALAWLREHGYRGRAVFLTGYGPANPWVEEARLAGDVAVLAKPLGVDALLQIIESTP